MDRTWTAAKKSTSRRAAAERALAKWGSCTGQGELFTRQDLRKKTTKDSAK